MAVLCLLTINILSVLGSSIPNAHAQPSGDFCSLSSSSGSMSCNLVGAPVSGPDPPVTLSAYTPIPPTIDGEIGASEWADAGTQNFVLNFLTIYRGTIYVMNNATDLYIALAISGGSITPTPLLSIVFDNNDTGTIVAGDTALNAAPGFADSYVSFVNSTELAQAANLAAIGTDDAQVAYTNNSTTNFFEFSHRLCSGIPDDFCLHAGDTVGFSLIYTSDCSVTPCPVGTWPAGAQAFTDASQYGKIVIATPSSTPLSVNISPTSQTITLGGTVPFTAAPNGGSGSYVDYTWTWEELNTADHGSFDSGTSNQYSFSPSIAGSYGVYVVVTDSSGATAQSLEAMITVEAVTAMGYLILFQQSGLTPIYVWEVTFNGVTEYSNGPGNTYAAIGFQDIAAGGPYVFTVGAPSGFYACPAAGVVQVSGDTNRQIDFQTSPCAVTYVVQPIIATFASTYGGSYQDVAISGCSPSTSSFVGDGSPYNIVMTASCSFTLTLPPGYHFIDGSGATTCPSGTCPTYTISYEKNAPTILSSSSSPTTITLPSTQTVTDTATVTGGSSNLAGTVSFALYYNDPTCSSAPVYTDNGVTLSVTEGTGTASSSAAIPSSGWMAGTYYWGVSGSLTDSSDLSPRPLCGGPGETVTVAPPLLQSTNTVVSCIPTLITAGLKYVPGFGGIAPTETTCTATVSGVSGNPSGTVSFTTSSSTGVFDPSDGQCAIYILDFFTCSVTYSDTTPGISVTITGTYGGSTTNAPSSDSAKISVQEDSDYIGNDNAEFNIHCSYLVLCSYPSHVSATMTLDQDLQWQGDQPTSPTSGGSEISLQYNPDGLKSWSNTNGVWFQPGIIGSIQEQTNGQPESCFAGAILVKSINTFNSFSWSYHTPTSCMSGTGAFDAGAVWQISDQVDSSTNEITGVTFSVTTPDGGSWVPISCTTGAPCVGFCEDSAGNPVTCVPSELPSGYNWIEANLCLCAVGGFGSATFTSGYGTFSYSSDQNLYLDLPPTEHWGNAPTPQQGWVETQENSNILYGCMQNSGSMEMSQTFMLSAPADCNTFTIKSDSPVNLLVTDPNGNEAGFEANGTQVNQIGGAALVGPCSAQSDQLVSITIPNPLPGQYQITAFPSCAEPGGSPYTINVQSTSGTGTYAGTAYQGGTTQQVFASLSSDGQVTISSSPTPPTGVPQFPFGMLALLAVVLPVLLFMRSRRTVYHE